MFSWLPSFPWLSGFGRSLPARTPLGQYVDLVTSPTEKYILKKTGPASLELKRYEELKSSESPNIPKFIFKFPHLCLTYCGVSLRLLSLDTPSQLLVFKDVCSALEIMHIHSIIHYDIYSSNILVGIRGNEVVATLCDLDHSKDGRSSGLHLPTPNKKYLPPSQERLTTLIDVYSVGYHLSQLAEYSNYLDASLIKSCLLSPDSRPSLSKLFTELRDKVPDSQTCRRTIADTLLQYASDPENGLTKNHLYCDENILKKASLYICLFIRSSICQVDPSSESLPFPGEVGKS